MKNTFKKVTSVIGIIVGVIIIIIGFSLQNTSNYSIGEQIKFGADFYTEMYDVTKDVGRAINHAINDLICAVGWLIISLGAIDICFFVYKLVQAADTSMQSNIEHINNNVQLLTIPTMLKYEKEDTHEAEERSRCENKESSKYEPEKAENETHGTSWTCGKCKKTNLNTRTNCWSCGNPK